MTAVLRLNRKAQTKLQEQLQSLKEEQEARNADFARVSSEVRHELVRMKAFGEMYQEYSLANLTTKRKLYRRDRMFLSRDNRTFLSQDSVTEAEDNRTKPQKIQNGVDDVAKPADDATKPEKEAKDATEQLVDGAGVDEEINATKEINNESAIVKIKPKVQEPVVPLTGPFALYRGPGHRPSRYLNSPSKTFIRTSGAFSLHRDATALENAEADTEPGVKKKVSVLVKKVGNGLPKVKSSQEPSQIVTHITNYYGYHTVTQNDGGDKLSESKQKPTDLTRESTAMFAKRRAALLPSNIKTAYAFRKFMDQRKAEVIKESTPEKVRQKKLQKLVPTVKFPEIIQRGRTLSAIIRDHEEYKRDKQPSPEGSYGRLAQWRFPALHRKYGSSPELKLNKIHLQNLQGGNAPKPQGKLKALPNVPYNEEHMNNLHNGQLNTIRSYEPKDSDPLDEKPPHLKANSDNSGNKKPLVDTTASSDIEVTKDKDVTEVNPAYKILITETLVNVNEPKKYVRPRLERVEETM